MAGYKINERKSTAIVYANNTKTEEDLTNRIPFKTAERSMKYLGINLTKSVGDLFEENYKKGN